MNDSRASRSCIHAIAINALEVDLTTLEVALVNWEDCLALPSALEVALVNWEDCLALPRALEVALVARENKLTTSSTLDVACIPLEVPLVVREYNRTLVDRESALIDWYVDLVIGENELVVRDELSRWRCKPRRQYEVVVTANANVTASRKYIHQDQIKMK